jgi:hypothetical protein
LDSYHFLEPFLINEKPLDDPAFPWEVSSLSFPVGELLDASFRPEKIAWSGDEKSGQIHTESGC